MHQGRSLGQPRIAAVVIGRNEGDRLMACLRSVLKCVPDVIYVDSGSNDGSVERANALGVRTIHLAAGPYTAARGRSIGTELLERELPGIEFVLYVDGDCTLAATFVETAIAFLDRHPRAAAVAGRRREQGSDFWSRVIDLEWDVPAGVVTAVGGDSIMRLSAVHEAGGWPVDVIAGEEPDLCLRMGGHGWECHRISAEMTTHDIRMTNVRQYLRRGFRSGHAYAEVAWRRRRRGGGGRLRSVLSILLYGAVIPLAALISSFVFWPAVVVCVLLYVRLMVVLAVRCRRRGHDLPLAIAYATLTTVGKFSQTLGVFRFVLGRVLGRRSKIVEYQVPTGGGA